MASLSVCMLVQDSEKTLPIALESLEGVYDELILVDGGSRDRTLEIAARYGATIIHSPWKGDFARQRNVHLEKVKTDWFFVLDSDEFINLNLLKVLQGIVNDDRTLLQHDYFSFPRKWITSSNLDCYISSPPHYPDYQVRLIKKSAAISYIGIIHAIIQVSNPTNGASIREACIYHLDLFINSQEKRQKKVLHYESLEKGAGAKEYYLPEGTFFNRERWDIDSVSSAVRNLLNQSNLNLSSYQIGENKTIQVVECKICNCVSQFFSSTIVLNQYEVDYYQCINCGFVQTEEPYWLNEAYERPIAKSDYGLVSRNISFSRLTASIIANLFDLRANFLDYGSGYGLLVRLMRDMGINFFGYDLYCESLFATETIAEESQESFELVTAFEVFEHFVNPLQDIEQILQFSRNILFSTELLPPSNPKPGEWGYYVPHEGQHIAIYTVDALTEIAKKFNLNLYTDRTFIHLLSDRELPQNLYKVLDFSRYCSVFQETRNTLWSDLKINVFSERMTGGEVKNSIGKLKILIDGIFFQYYNTGIARVWESLLKEWSSSEFAEYLLVLDRANSAPRVSGIEYLTIAQHDYSAPEADRDILQHICDEQGATLFVSTYYTTPIRTPSVFVAYDMIPEVFGADFENNSMWREKHVGLQYASAYLSISENTARDLLHYFPEIDANLVTVAHCGREETFQPANPEEIAQFKLKYGISQPYFLLVAPSSGYKNAQLFFEAFSQLPARLGFAIVSTGNRGWYDEAWREYTMGNTVYTLQLNDEELRLAYAGAVALVYPSKYEGFGLPVLEALACGCPVITTPNASIPEVAGEAALYVKDDDVEGMANALCEVQKPAVRQSLIALGLDRAQQFSWAKMAEIVSSALIEATLLPLKLREVNWIIFPDWTQAEAELVGELQQVLKGVATHPDRDRMTLLIETTGMTEEDATLLLSAAVMNLFLEEEIDVSESAEIAFVGELAPIQWDKLKSRLQGRISLNFENESRLLAVNCDRLPVQFVGDDGRFQGEEDKLAIAKRTP